MDVEFIKPHVGATIHAEPSALLDGSLAPQIRELVEERGVVVFPRLGFTNEEQLQFTQHLGPPPPIGGSRKGASTSDYETEGVYVVTLDKKVNTNPEYVHGTFFWHIDGLLGNIPIPKASVLSCRKKSPIGGQTEFANTYAAYKFLSDEDKAALEGVQVSHSLYAILSKNVKIPNAEEIARWTQAPVRPHGLVMPQRSGRRSLLIGGSADYLLDMDIPVGRSILARLLDWAAQPDFTYRHEWSEGDMVIWDNAGVLHRAVPYPEDSGRWMNRTSVDHEWGMVAAVPAE